MRNNKPSKSFSFQIAKTEPSKDKVLKARDGVAVAGCTDAGPIVGNFRARTRFGDTGFFC